MSLNKEKQRLVDEIVKELNDDNFAIFAGAGLSSGAGFVDWKSLLKPIAEDLDLDIKRENDLVAIAQYHCNKNMKNRAKLNQIILDELSRKVVPTKNHEIISRLPIKTIWTTNYDKLIENTLESSGKIVDVKHTNKQLILTKKNRDVALYKMHGDVNHPSEAVLTKDDYEFYHVRMQPFISALSGDLATKLFLFIGFSFTDPNLDYVLSRIKITYSDDQRQHYCLLKKVSQLVDESLADFEYHNRKQELFVQDLLRFGIKCIMVDEYSEITEILEAVERRYNRRSIFISGAISDYSQFGKDEVENFIYNLSKELSSIGYKIVSGFGLGVGSAVISGTLENIYMSGEKLNRDQLVLMPFPQTNIDKMSIEEVWNKYREDMISRAGISLFIFGNKIQDGKTVISTGMLKEAAIANKYGAVVLPIGSTGYAAKEIYDSIDFNKYFNGFTFSKELIKNIQLLDSEKDLVEVRNIIIKMINLVVKGV